MPRFTLFLNQNCSIEATRKNAGAVFSVQLSDQAASGWSLCKNRRWAYTEVALDSPHTPLMLRNVLFVLVLLTVAATSTFASTARAAKAHTRATRSSVTRPSVTHGKSATHQT